MNIRRTFPRFLICYPPAGEADLWPDAFLFDSDHNLFWIFDDDGNAQLFQGALPADALHASGLAGDAEEAWVDFQREAEEEEAR